MGFVHPVHEGLIKSLGLALDPRGNVKADTIAYQTSIPKVFAAGDMRRGQSLVVWAIREGRQARARGRQVPDGRDDAAAVARAINRRRTHSSSRRGASRSDASRSMAARPACAAILRDARVARSSG